MHANLTKNHLISSVVSAAVTLLVGILFTAKPFILEKICMIAGGALCVLGAVLLVLFFVKRQNIHLTYGVVCLAAGILLCIIPSLLKFLIPILFGLWILTSAGSGLFRNLSYRNSYPHWWVGMLLNAVCAAVGVYVITRPVATMEATVRLIGIAMIVHAVLRLVAVFMGRKCYTGTVIETTIGE